jgi:hypothetical protein
LYLLVKCDIQTRENSKVTVYDVGSNNEYDEYEKNLLRENERPISFSLQTVVNLREQISLTVTTREFCDHHVFQSQALVVVPLVLYRGRDR